MAEDTLMHSISKPIYRKGVSYHLFPCVDCGEEHLTQKTNGGRPRNPRCLSCAAKIRSTGRIVKPETRAKISKSLMGHPSFSKSGRKMRPEEIERIRERMWGNTFKRGKKLSMESRERIRLANIKSWTPERREKQSERNKGNNHNWGLKKSLEARANMSKARIGKKISEKTRMAIIRSHTTEYRERMSARMKELHNSPDSPFKKLSCRKKHSMAFKAMWKDPYSKVNTPEHRAKMSERAMELLRMNPQSNYNKSEKKLDTIIQRVLPLQYKYNGCGQLGFKIYRHVPDFVNVNGQKKIIEFNGCAWHCCPVCGRHHPYGVPQGIVRSRDKKHITDANNLGYNVLTIWGHELRDEKALIEKLVRFNNVK